MTRDNLLDYVNTFGYTISEGKSTEILHHGERFGVLIQAMNGNYIFTRGDVKENLDENWFLLNFFKSHFPKISMDYLRMYCGIVYFEQYNNLFQRKEPVCQTTKSIKSIAIQS